ncbi:MAG: hypothetical protein WC542_07925, partial [Paludibacter sp.]
FIKPVVDWNYEQKRAKIESRRKLINDSRLIISKSWKDIYVFRQTGEYLRLQEYFSEELQDIFNMDIFDYYYKVQNSHDDLNDEYRYLTLKEINSLSKKWGLEY